jgi:two-component system, NarL family, nitrate/nitrite response regulator NarL
MSMDENKEIGILLVEDQRLEATGTQTHLRQAGYEKLKWAPNVEAAHDELKIGQFDIVIADLHLPRRKGERPSFQNGLDLIDDNTAARIPQFVISKWAQQNAVQPVLDRKIGFLAKDDITDELLHYAIRTTLAGGIVYSLTAVDIVQSLLSKPHLAHNAFGLTHRELEVLFLFVLVYRGEDNADGQVADLLVISPSTAATHRKHAMEKLDIHKQGNLVPWVMEHQELFDQIRESHRNVMIE